MNLRHNNRSGVRAEVRRVNVERAIEQVYRAHQQGGRVLDRRSAEALVRLVITALGVNIEVRGVESDIQSPQDNEDDGAGVAPDISQS